MPVIFSDLLVLALMIGFGYGLERAWLALRRARERRQQQ